ncbi:hypothetical protein SLA2020_151500 [Shorea laevis]
MWEADRTGTLAKALSDAFPHLDCTIFDLPHVVTGLQGSNNLKYVGGDMFDAVPPAKALLLIKGMYIYPVPNIFKSIAVITLCFFMITDKQSILHDCSEKEFMKTLDRCKDAIKKNGKMIIIDMVRMNRGEEELIETQLLVDMVMMVVVTGKERNAEERSKLFSEDGFSGFKILPILGLRSPIEVYPRRKSCFNQIFQAN